MAKDALRFFFSSTVGVLLALKFTLLAALPLRFFRLSYGRVVYYCISLSSFCFLLGLRKIEWAITYVTLALLVGAYSEMESKTPKTLVLNASVALITAVTASVGSMTFWAYNSGLNLVNFLAMKYSVWLEPLLELPQWTHLDFDIQSLFWFFPGALGLMCMFALFISLSVFSRPSPFHSPLKLKDFRLPDVCVWFFIPSLAGTFLLETLTPLHVISVNSLILLLGIFFFQGLAVLTSLMDRYRVQGVWRLLLLFFIFFQGLIFVSIVGLIDFWADFRKFSKGPQRQRPQGQE